MVLVFGGDDPDGLKGEGGTKVVAAPTVFFLRSPFPLLTNCPDNAANITSVECLCPMKQGTFDSACRVATGLTRDQATQLEPLRQQAQAALTALLPAAGPKKAAR